MDKDTRNYKKNDDQSISTSTKIISIFLLLLMVLSIVGFAMMSAGPRNSNNQNLPDNLAVQQFENNGQIFWAAIKNKEIFYFQSIEGYENANQEKELAQKILSKSNLKLYIDKNFESSDSIYLIEKALNSLKINNERIETLDINNCNENILIITNNLTQESNCLEFKTPQFEEYQKTEILIYHLVKN